nr:retrovirus-related Pol polyprotein from transposon TNT 1-94 [Tanacetum cinerariifolium]
MLSVRKTVLRCSANTTTFHGRLVLSDMQGVDQMARLLLTLNGPYVRRMITTPGEPDLPVPVPESLHEQTDEELTETDIKWMDADDQAIQTILLGLPKDVYVAVDSCETAKEIWEHVRQMMKASDIKEQEKKEKLFNEWEKFTSSDRESIKSYYHRFMQLMNDLKRNKHFPENIALNLKFLNNLQPEWKRHVTIVRQTKNLHEANFTQIYDFLNMNQEEVNELRAERFIKSHDPLALMAHSQNSFNFPTTHKDQSSSSTHPQQSFAINNKYNPQPSLNQNFMQPPMTSFENINDPTEAINAALILFAKAFQLSAPTNNNQRTLPNPRNRQIAQPVMNMGAQNAVQNTGVQSGGNQNGLVVVPGIANQSGTSNVVAARAEGIGIGNQARCYKCRGLGDLDEIEEVNANCILMATLQQASTSGTQHDKAPIYDTYGSAENDNHVTSVALSMVHSGGTVETSSAPIEEIRAHQETIYRNLVDQVAQEKYDKLEKCYQKSIYQEQCLTRKINALHLSSAKQITTLNDEISNLNKQLSKEKSSISSLMEEKKRLKHDFKTREDKFLDKEVDLEAKIKDLENILLKKDQTVQTMHVLNPKPDLFYHPNQKMALGYPNPSYLKKAQLKQKSLYNGNLLLEEHDPPAVYDSEETLELAQESREKMRLLKKEIKPTNYAKINHLSRVFVPQMTKSKEELFLSNVSNMVTISKTISIPNEDLSDDTTPRLVHTARTRRPQPKGNTRNTRIPSASKSSDVKKIVMGKDHRRNLLLSKNQKTMSSECNNIKLTIRNDKSKIVCDTCCSKDMTENIKLLINFVWKFLGIVRFGNDHIAAIMGYGDLKRGNITITRVYFVEGLGHNLFSVGQFCDADLEVAFRRNTCFIRDLDDVDLLKENHSTNLYTINLYDMASVSPICHMARATPTKSWLWHQRLSHLNLDTINDLAKNDLISDLPKFKYAKEHLFPSCEQGKSKRDSHPPKPVSNSKQWLHLLHMDLCGPMRVARINGKRYVLVIVDDYSRYTWVHFLRTKDETLEVIKNFLKKIYVRLQAPVIIVRTDNKMKFKNQVLKEYFDSFGIIHETYAVKTPQQNRVVERRNRTLVEATRTMLIFSHAPLFRWAEAIATVCYTQNCSIIHRHFNKTPYELIQGRKPDISYLHVFEALCYPKNDREDIGKLGAKGDIGFFIGYSANSMAYRVYNRRTKKIMETMNVTFDVLSAMAFKQNSSRPGLQSMTSGQISYELELTYAPSIITPQRPSERDLDILFELLHNEYLGGRPAEASKTIPVAHVLQNLQAPTASMSFQDSALNLTLLPTTSAADNVPNAVFEGDLFVNPFGTPSTESVVSSTQYVDPSNMHTFNQPYPYDYQWTKDHPLEQVIEEPS